MSPGEEWNADRTILVVGASLAGWRAVETLRSEGFDGKISLIGEEQHLPYDRPPLSKQVLAGTWPPEKAVLADKRRSSEHRVHEVLGRRAVGLDAESHKVELDDGTVLKGDGIVITTGARPRPLPGTEGLSQRDGLFTLRTLDDSLALRAAVTAVDGARVVVIGAGFIGAEVASTCAGLGCRVTVLEALDVPLRNVLGPLIGSHFAALHESHGVDLRTGVGVQGVRRVVAGEGAARRGAQVRAGSWSSSVVARHSMPTWSSWASVWCRRRTGWPTPASPLTTASCVTSGSSRPTASWRQGTLRAGDGVATAARS